RADRVQFLSRGGGGGRGTRPEGGSTRERSGESSPASKGPAVDPAEDDVPF
ncbi:MAG: single-stranded DNA-binding protein, partial [Verrucomicrobia bacterium]|nr:single-stranded DNA-binding protein [Verrucomicrobiota bacterium]